MSRKKESGAQVALTRLVSSVRGDECESLFARSWYTAGAGYVRGHIFATALQAQFV
jgi:hypothetical protein